VLADELVSGFAPQTVADHDLAADFQHNQPLDLVASAATFAFLQWGSCLLLCVAVFTYKAWAIATKNLLIGAADVHVVRGEVGEGMVGPSEAS
jgi:hypothetical protein